MECHAARELLQEELDGLVAPADAARLADHVAGCASCARERSELGRLRAAFRASPRPAAPPGFRDEVMAALPRGRVLRLPRVVGLLAAAAAAVLVVVTLLPRGPRYEASERSTARVEDFRGGVPEAAQGERQDAPARQAQGAADDAASKADRLEGALPPAAPPPADAPSPSVAAAKAPAGKAEAPAKEELEKSAAVAGEIAQGAQLEGRLGSAQAEEPEVQYVVFRDAAAARRFAAALAAGFAEPATKDQARDKSLDGGAAGRPAVGPAPGSAAASAAASAEQKTKETGDRRGGDLVAGLEALAGRRVVWSQEVPASVRAAELAVRASREGGTLATAAETEALGRLVDGDRDGPTAFADEKGEKKVAGGGGAGEAKETTGARKRAGAPQTGASAPPAPAEADANAAVARDAEAARVVRGPRRVVVVVVEESPKAAPTKPR